jgi:hypothetical protein
MQHKNFFFLIALFFLSACGGGGGSGSSESKQPPVPEIQPTLDSFVFLQSNNSSLNEDITLTLSNAGSSYSATVSSSLVLTDLVASFNFTGSSVTANGITQQSGITQNNFTDPVIYTVSNIQGTTRDYQIELIKAIAPTINEFRFTSEKNSELDQNVNFELNGNTFNGRVAQNINISELIADFSYTGSSISIDGNPQESGVTPNNFDNVVIYKVANDLGDEAIYEVDVAKFTGLPVIYLNTDGSVQIDSKEDYVGGDVSLDGRRDFASLSDLSMKIRGRGNSTWFVHPKKPFQMKLSDKSAFLGMPEDKKWLFLAEYSDKTMLRNTIAFELGYMSNLDWTPAGEFAEVFLNGEYNGTYNITQKVEESDNRVVLGDTGYLLELDQLDRIDPDDVYFESTITNRFIINIKEPSLEYDSDEYTYIKNLVAEFESALFDINFKDENTGYKKYIDLESFIDWYLISEITKNVDSRWYSSIYLNVIPGEKIKMGPLWDFDLAFGNTDYADTQFYEGWWVRFNPWYERLFQDPYFTQMVKNRFIFFKNNEDLIIEKIDAYAEKLKWAQAENNDKWETLGRYVWPNPVVYDTYQEEVEHLKNWYQERMDWLDEAFNEL